MSSGRTLPEEFANLYPTSNDWVRAFPWTYTKHRNDKFETVFRRVVCPAGAEKPVEQRVRVAVPRSIFWNSHAALWDIAGQIRRSNNVARTRTGQYRRVS